MTATAKRKTGSVAFWAACAALPIILFCGLAIWGGVYPFGSESFLTEDLKYQYIDFFTWFRGVLLGENSIFYSFAQGLGSNTWGLYSYYTASPFNLLLVLFDQDHPTLAVFVITALKLSCISLSMAYYLRRRFELNYLWSLLLALSFTFSSWTVTQLRNPMWLDALILLPLGATCCRRVIREGKFLGLALVVAADIICCWYMAYISILFFCLFVLFELGAYAFRGNRIDARFVGGRALRFTAGMLLGLALSAWTFVPTILAMLGGDGTAEASELLATTWRELVRGVLPGMWRLDRSPQLYTGIVVELLALAFLFNPRIPWRLRLLAFGFALFIVASSILNPLQYIWCGFRNPNGFYSRTAFLTSFTLLWMAAYCAKMGFGVKHVVTPSRQGIDCTQKKLLSWRIPPKVVAALIPITVIELLVSGHLSWNQLYTDYPQGSHDDYVTETQAQLDSLRAFDSEPFYRIDKTHARAGLAALNDGIARGYAQLSSYSSTSDSDAIAFLNALGYSSEGEFSTRYSTPILATDSLFGVKYASTFEGPAEYLSTGLPARSNGAALYQNPYALSIGFLAPSLNSDVNIMDYGNPFDRQNALFRSLSGNAAILYRPLEATQTDTHSWNVSVPPGTIGYAYVIIDPEAGSNHPVGITIGESFAEEGWRFDHTLRALNSLSSNPQTVPVSIVPFNPDGSNPSATVPPQTEVLFYGLDIELFRQTIGLLSASQLEVESISDDSLTGAVVSDGASQLVLSIPYDSGWTVNVNGRTANPAPLYGGAMMAIPVPEGESAVAMSYRSPGLFAGICISGIAAIAFCLCATVQAIGRRRRQSAGTHRSA